MAVSVSENPDLQTLGLSDDHLHDAMETLASQLLAFGYRLAYGGDLRPEGFTEQLFEFASRYDRTRQSKGQLGVVDYLAWPVHARMPAEEKSALADGLAGVADVVWLSPEGLPLKLDNCTGSKLSVISPDDWAEGLTAMRRTMLDNTSACIVLGGRVEGYSGVMPGIAEESRLALEVGQPLYLLGGFGGCARDIAESLGLVAPWQPSRREWEGRRWFDEFDFASINNGLTWEEKKSLARTPHVDEAVLLTLIGLERSLGDHGSLDNPRTASMAV